MKDGLKWQGTRAAQLTIARLTGRAASVKAPARTAIGGALAPDNPGAALDRDVAGRALAHETTGRAAVRVGTGRAAVRVGTGRAAAPGPAGAAAMTGRIVTGTRAGIRPAIAAQAELAGHETVQPETVPGGVLAARGLTVPDPARASPAAPGGGRLGPRLAGPGVTGRTVHDPGRARPAGLLSARARITAAVVPTRREAQARAVVPTGQPTRVMTTGGAQPAAAVSGSQTSGATEQAGPGRRAAALAGGNATVQVREMARPAVMVGAAATAATGRTPATAATGRRPARGVMVRAVATAATSQHPPHGARVRALGTAATGRVPARAGMVRAAGTAVTGLVRVPAGMVRSQRLTSCAWTYLRASPPISLTPRLSPSCAPCQGTLPRPSRGCWWRQA
jgi:collagen type I alpha